MDGSNPSTSDILEPDQSDDDQDVFDSLDIAIDERLFQVSVDHLAASVQDPFFSQAQEPVSHSSETSAILNTRDRSRDSGELNFDVLMKRCEDDMELVIAVLEAFCSQGAASCSALELALEKNEDSQLLLQAV
jgi:hypothetical protein